MIGYYEKQPDAPEPIYRLEQDRSISPAAKFCWIAWRDRHTHNRDTLNQIRSQLVTTALECGIEWYPNDLKEMPFIWPNETHYAKAIGDHGSGSRCQSNSSFVKAFERFRNRKPFLFAWDTKSRKRLYVGCRFSWQGLMPTVTSIDDEKGTLTACTYKYEKSNGKVPIVGDYDYFAGSYRRVVSIEEHKETSGFSVSYGPASAEADEPAKIERRFTITPQDLVDAERASEAKLDEWIKRIGDIGYEAVIKDTEKQAADHPFITPYHWEQIRATLYDAQYNAQNKTH